jgi:hypothetical protein
MRAGSSVRNHVERAFIALSLVIGLAAFVSMGQALGEAVGKAYSAPPEILD